MLAMNYYKRTRSRRPRVRLHAPGTFRLALGSILEKKYPAQQSLAAAKNTPAFQLLRLIQCVDRSPQTPSTPRLELAMASKRPMQAPCTDQKLLHWLHI